MAAVCTLCGDESAHAIVFLTLLTIGGKEHHSGARRESVHPILNGAPPRRKSQSVLGNDALWLTAGQSYSRDFSRFLFFLLLNARIRAGVGFSSVTRLENSKANRLVQDDIEQRYSLRHWAVR